MNAVVGFIGRVLAVVFITVICAALMLVMLMSGDDFSIGEDQ